MKIAADRWLWLIAFVACNAALSVACGSDAGSTPDSGAAGSAGAVTAGAAGASGAGSAGSAGVDAVSGGGMAGAGGAAGGAMTGPGGGTGGAGDAGGNSAGAGGTSGVAGSGGGSLGPSGVVSCQPAFETACKPAIEFVNGDPNGRGKVFTNVVPDVEKTMQDIACVVCSMLYREPSEIPQNKHPSTIKLVLDEHGGVAQAGGGQIQFDLNYINGYANQSEAITKQEMLGVLQHETVHLYQNYGNGGTGEGMADLVRTRMGYYQRNRWTKGGSWKDAYTASGFFYSWLTGPCAFHEETLPAHDLNLPYKLNKALANAQGDAAYTAVNDLLQDTFGRDADSLWQEYQDTAFND